MKAPTCSPSQNECFEELENKLFGCNVSCAGLFADIGKKKVKPTSTDDLEAFDTERRLKVERLLAQYKKYKKDFSESISFEPAYFFTGYSVHNTPQDSQNYSMYNFAFSKISTALR